MNELQFFRNLLSERLSILQLFVNPIFNFNFYHNRNALNLFLREDTMEDFLTRNFFSYHEEGRINNSLRV